MDREATARISSAAVPVADSPLAARTSPIDLAALLGPALEPAVPVAVFGAGGFLGRKLVAALRASGVSTGSFFKSTPLPADGAFFDGSAGPGVVFWVATTINPGLAERHPERVGSDHEAFRRLLARLREADRPPVVVLASSGGAVYSPRTAPPYREDSPLGSDVAYGRAKLGLERELLANRDKVRPVVLRISNMYGPGQRTGTGLGVVAYWLEAAAAKRPLRVLGDPRTVRDYVYVDDVVEVMARIHRIACASGAESLPDVLNIGSGVPTSLMDMLAAVVTTVGGVVSVEFAGGRPFDRSDVWLDVTKARRCVGWSARTPLELGVQRTWAHLTRQRLVNGPDGRNE